MTDLTINGKGNAEFRIGLALSQAWAVLTRAPVQFLLLSLIPLLPTFYLLLMPSVATPGEFRWVRFTVTLLAQMFLTFLTEAVMVYGAFQEMRGQGFTLAEAVAKGLSRAPAVFGVAVLATILTFLGMIALIVPGIIVAVALYVAIPVCVVERLGPAPSLSRSANLTKGFRGKIFGLLLVVGIAGAAVGYAVRLVLGQVGGIYVGALGEIGVQAVATAFGTVLVAIIYYNLRAIKEGIDIEKIASVFD